MSRINESSEHNDKLGGPEETAESDAEPEVVQKSAAGQLRAARDEAVQKLNAAFEEAISSLEHAGGKNKDAPLPFMEALAAGVLPFAMTDEKFDWPNSTFRAQRLPLDHAGLAGRTLLPLHHEVSEISDPDGE